MPLGTEVGLCREDIVLDGDPAPPQQKGAEPPSPSFGPCLLSPNGCMGQDGTCHGGGLWSSPQCARRGPSSSPKTGALGRAPQLLAHFYCGQTAGCIKMPLGMEIGLSPGVFVLDGDPTPSPTRAEPPIFGPRLLWPNGCMDQNATWYGGRPRPTRHCVVDGDPVTPRKKAHPPNFLPMSIVAKRLDG